MPACDARYDVILSDGFSSWNSSSPRTQAVVDFIEDRLPDEWGDPGQLLGARFVAGRSNNGRRIGYGRVGIRNRLTLTVDGSPCQTAAKHRRYLRWRWQEYDPPVDPDYPDPA